MIKNNFIVNFIQAVFNSARWWLVLSIILSLVSGLMQSVGIFLLFPLLESVNILPTHGQSSWIGDHFSALIALTGFENSLISILLMFVGLIFLRNFITRWQALLNPKIVMDYAKQLRKQMYAATVAVDWLYFCRQTPANFTQILSSDIDRISYGVFDLNQLISQSLLMLGYGVAALLINWQLTCWVMIAGLVSVIFQHRMSQRAYRLGLAQTKHDQALYHWISETLNNLKLIKSSDQEAHVGQCFDAIVDANDDIYCKANKHHADLHFYFNLYSTLILVGLIFISVTWWQLPGTSLLILIFVFSRMMPLVSSIWAYINQLKQMQGAYENYRHLYRQCLQHQAVAQQQNNDSVALDNAISLDKLSFNYLPGELANVLIDINLKIPARQITALLGVSGAGKTTLCDLIAGLYQPLTGTIAIDGVRLSAHNQQQWQRQIVYLTQETLLFNDSIRNNLLWYAKQADDQQLMQAIKSAELESWLASLPQGIDTQIGEKGVRLSGGEKQRLALARALLAKPSLLILDEASSSLDVINEQKITRIIGHIKQHTTIIVIAHRLSSLKIADNIVVIEQGRIVDQGQWSTLAAKKQGVFYQLLEQSLV